MNLQTGSELKSISVTIRQCFTAILEHYLLFISSLIEESNSIQIQLRNILDRLVASLGSLSFHEFTTMVNGLLSSSYDDKEDSSYDYESCAVGYVHQSTMNAKRHR